MANVIKLAPEVAAEFELVDWEGSSRQVFGKFGTIDVEKLTLRKARSLYKRGFKKLRLKQGVELLPANTDNSNKKKNSK